MIKHILLFNIADDDNKQDNLYRIREDLLGLASSLDGCLFAEIGFDYGMGDYEACFTAYIKNAVALRQFKNSPLYISTMNFIDSLDGESKEIDYMPEAEDTIDKGNGGSKKKTSRSTPIKPANTVKAESQTKASSDDTVDADASTNSASNTTKTAKTTKTKSTKSAKATKAKTNTVGESKDSVKLTIEPIVEQPTTEAVVEPVTEAIVEAIAEAQPITNTVTESMPDTIQPVATLQEKTDNTVVDEQPRIKNLNKPTAIPIVRPATAPSTPLRSSTSNVTAIEIFDEEEDDEEDVLPAIANRAKLSEIEDKPIIRIEPKGKTLKEGEISMAFAWKCPDCGKLNGDYVGLCGCGAHKPDSYEPVSAKELEARLSTDEDFVPDVVYKNNIIVPSFKDFSEAINNTISSTVKVIKNATGYDLAMQDTDNEEAQEIVTAFSDIAKDAEAEQDFIRIEPKGTHLEDGQMAMSNAWKCTKCNKINGAFVGLCGCGKRKPQNYKPVSIEDLKQYEAQTEAELIELVSAKEAPVKKSKKVSKTSKEKSALSQGISSLSTSISNATKKGMATLTDAMNNATDIDNSKKTYNEGLLASSSASSEPEIKRIEPKGSKPAIGESAMKNAWTCSKCGKTNASYIGQCGCGMRKTLHNELAY